MKDTIKKVKNYTVVQANDLIQNKKDFSLWELRVFALLASHVRKEDSDFHTYKFRIKDIIDLFECKSNNLYDELREVPERLHSKIIRIPYTDADGKSRTRRYNLVSMSDFPDGENMDDGEHIMLRFDKDLKPLLLQLGEHFTIYKFYNILKLRSTYVFQLYEILKSNQYRGKGIFEIKLDKLQSMLQLPDSYKYGNIRQRVLEPAKKQFKQHTDITFQYRPIKGRGGRVIRIWFQIFENTPDRLLAESVEVSSRPEDELYLQIAQWISRETFNSWLKQYPDSQVKNAVQYTLNQIKKGVQIENVGGYLAAMVKQTTLFDAVEVKKKRLSKKRQAEREQALKKASLDQELTQLYREKVIKENEIIQQLIQAQPQLEEETFQKVKASRFSGYDANKSKAENLADPIFNASFHNAIKKQFPTAFTHIDIKYNERIQHLKRAITTI
ncbi:MAG: replication initiation protein [Bacteroidota bacterium]